VDDDVVQVLTTMDGRDAAVSLAERLVEGRTAACVQVIGPIRSVYRWRGAVERAEEWLCVAKTTRRRYGDLERTIREGHPYDVPEITALPVVTGGADYLAWVAAETATEG
jgi:periplasmic divalent cation tolerance protein